MKYVFGLRIGFVTETMLSEGQLPKDCRMLIIPDIKHLSPAALKGLQAAGENGVELLFAGKNKLTMDEHAQPLSPDSVDFLKGLPRVDLSDAAALSEHMTPLLKPLNEKHPVKVTVGNREDAFGVMHRSAMVSGYQTLLLVNVSAKEQSVSIKNSDNKLIRGFDMLNCQHFDAKEIRVPIRGIRLIQVHDDVSSLTRVLINNRLKAFHT